MILPLPNGKSINIGLTEAIECLKHTLTHISDGVTKSTKKSNQAVFHSNARLINRELLRNAPETCAEETLKNDTTPEKYMAGIIKPLWDLVNYIDEMDKISNVYFLRKLRVVNKNQPLIEQAYSCIGLDGVLHIIDDKTYLLGLTFKLFFSVVLETAMPGYENTVKPVTQRRLTILKNRLHFYELHQEPDKLTDKIRHLGAKPWEALFYQQDKSKIGIHETINALQKIAIWTEKHHSLQLEVARLQKIVERNQQLLCKQVESHESVDEINALIASGRAIASLTFESNLADFMQHNHAVSTGPVNIFASHYHRVLAHPTSDHHHILEAWKALFNERPEPHLEEIPHFEPARIQKNVQSGLLLSKKAQDLIHELNTQMIQLQSLQQAVLSWSNDDKKETGVGMLHDQILEKNQRDNNAKKQSDSPRLLLFKESSSHKKLLPTPFHAENSCLTASEIINIQQHIATLDREIKSYWPYPHKDRKLQKMAGLHALLVNSTKKGAQVCTIIKEVEQRYPDLCAGYVSSRTAFLIDKIRENRTQRESLLITT